jgi:hypothetical protein
MTVNWEVQLAAVVEAVAAVVEAVVVVEEAMVVEVAMVAIVEVVEVVGIWDIRMGTPMIGTCPMDTVRTLPTTPTHIMAMRTVDTNVGKRISSAWKTQKSVRQQLVF